MARLSLGRKSTDLHTLTDNLHKGLTTGRHASNLASVRLTPRATLRDAIFRSGKSQREIAQLTGIQEADLSRIVRGRMNPTEDEQKALARVLKQDRESLFAQEVA